MSRNRTKTLLAGWVLAFLAAAPALGQGMQDMQMFAPVDELPPYGGGHRANEGFFFVFDGLAWNIGAPEVTTIGLEGATRDVVLVPQDPPLYNPSIPNLVTQVNSHTTGGLQAEWAGGQRYEFGYVLDHTGWLVSVFNLARQTQDFVSSDVSVVFSDPPFNQGRLQNLEGFINGDPSAPPADPLDPDFPLLGPLPVIFDSVEVRNTVHLWGVEMNLLRRAHPFHHGGILEVFAGARYLEFDEKFDVQALGGNLADSFWNTDADNHIIGPQFGFRWFRKTGRWTCSTEARGFAGYNSQNVRQMGQLGSLLDPVTNADTVLTITNMSPTYFSSGIHEQEFTPGVELRLDFKYQLTRAVSGRVGWTGLWIDGIARPSNLINYEVPNMGINMTNNHQWVFANGVTVGIEVNR